MLKKYYVYAHYDAKDILVYIGKGSGRRAYLCAQRPEKWKKYFKNSKPTKIVIIEDNLTEEMAYQREMYHISRAFEKGLAKLNTKQGPKHTEETKQKISQNKIGKSNGLKGRIMPEEHKQKISIARLNSDKVKSSCKQIWETRKQNGTDKGWISDKAKPILCITTNKEFRCAKEAALFYNCSDKHIQACCTGRRETHAKMRWRYL